MIDFLTFQSFISPFMLIIFYYMGALILPFTLWKLSTYMITQFRWFDILYQKGQHLAWKSLSSKQRFIVILLFLSMFMMMEIIWRMMFEFLIAYMQIRDVLVQL